jgi:hypothetical protein
MELGSASRHKILINPNAGELPQLLREPQSEQKRNTCVVGMISLEASMSGEQSPRKAKSSDMQTRDEANLGQKEARLEKEKASELTSMGEKSRESKKNERDKDQ